MRTEKQLPMLEDIYFEAIVSMEVDYDSSYDRDTDRYTNNLKVYFTARGYTICRTLQELCKAAHIPFVEYTYDNNVVGKDRRELMTARRITTTSYICRLIDRRSPSEPWCVGVCAALLKLIADS